MDAYIVVIVGLFSCFAGVLLGYFLSYKYWRRIAMEEIEFHSQKWHQCKALCDEMVDELTEIKMIEEERSDV